MDLKDKCAIVTGVSKGIGKAIVLQLLQEGCRVIGWGRNAGDIQHPAFSFLTCNVADATELDQAFEKSLSLLNGRLDFLVNNAGLGYFKPVEEISLAEWKEMFSVNVDSVFYSCRKAVPLMKKQQSGYIINISSIAGLNGIPEASAYCATKHAVRGFSHALQAELRKEGIKVSVIYPGSVHTDFFRNYPGIRSNDSFLHPDDIAAQVIHLLKLPAGSMMPDLEIRPMFPVYK